MRVLRIHVSRSNLIGEKNYTFGTLQREVYPSSTWDQREVYPSSTWDQREVYPSSTWDGGC